MKSSVSNLPKTTHARMPSIANNQKAGGRSFDSGVAHICPAGGPAFDFEFYGAPSFVCRGGEGGVGARVRVSECSPQKPLDSSLLRRGFGGQALRCGAEGAPQGASFRMTIAREAVGQSQSPHPLTAKGAAPVESSREWQRGTLVRFNRAIYRFDYGGRHFALTIDRRPDTEIAGLE